MGASGWKYVVRYQDDPSAALEDLRREVFSQGHFRNPANHGLPVPESVDDLLNETYGEFMGTSGTHSIIDMLRVVPADDHDQEYCTIRPLTAEETGELFGSSAPGRLDFDAVSASTLLESVTSGRWTGRSVVLWVDDRPDEIAFWGVSGH